jgi:tetratricopeptide (TPR) repeat protein
MSNSFTGKSFRAASVAAAVLGFASIAHAQGQGVGNQTQMGTMGGGMTDQLSYGNFGAQVERDQNNAYQAFVKERDPAKKIQKAHEFLQKYPKSLLTEQVYSSLMDVYRMESDWKDEYQYADQALALNPNDVDVLATVGWTIPHVYNPSDADADQELDKAEKYAKHAIEVLATIPKPPDMNDAQFTAVKAKRTSQAHSALGLVYFRRNDYEDSAKELELSTKGNPVQDQTDLYVLGVDFQNLNRFSDAAEAFRGCGQIAGALQDPCRQGATAAGAQAGNTKTHE